ncbi:unnamed protein product [Oncorhynchus mykiss]|uniref:Beta'-coat protein n=1 Tax=Oncorhynchus mykiss TaxID=8022 RepID=A0A060Y5V3_ONCMY|nr:unnamed protein product [Oncorhynchus mykiss]
MVASLYNGSVCVWNHETQTLVKTFEVCDLPVRVAKFVARKHWVIAGADDMQIRVFNYNTLERAHMFEAHSDYIRCIAVHPTQPYILTSSDDMLIKLWDWDRKWVCGQVFEGHTHYVMQIVINPKDNNQFASASLDRTIKVWQLGSSSPNFTLEGHEKGVNCIDYYSGGDKPYLISGADDRLVKIWDYQVHMEINMETQFMYSRGQSFDNGPPGWRSDLGHCIAVFWSESGELVCIATEESFFVLRYLAEKVATAQETKEGVTEDGIEDAFEVLGEIQEVVKTGLWVGDCFIYTSSVNRLNYYVGGEIVTVAHLDRTMYLLGYIPKDDRLYLGDKELNIVTYSLLVSVLEYQTAVMRRDFGMADRVLPTIPKEMRTRVAHFLEKQGFMQQALAVSTDSEHRFELALQLGELKIAYQLAVEAESEQKWKQLAELATTKCQFVLAQECLHHAQDYGGLLLLATASGNTTMVGKLAEGAERDGKTNVAFLTYFLQGKLDKCLELLIKTNRLPEAAFLARTYLPSHVSRYSTGRLTLILSILPWRHNLAKLAILKKCMKTKSSFLVLI